MGSLKETKDLKNKKKNKNPKLFEKNENVNEVEEKHEKSRPTEKKKKKKKRKRENGNNVDAGKALQISIEDNSNKATGEKKNNKSKKKKRKSEEQSNVVVGKFDQTGNNAEDSHDEQNDEKVNKVEEENEKCRPTEKKKKRKRGKGNNIDTGKALQISIEDNSNKLTGEKKKNKLRKKKRKSKEQSNAVVGKFDQTGNNADDGHDEQNDDGEADQSLFETQGEIKNPKGHGGADNGIKIKTRKSKKAKIKKNKKKDHDNLECERSSDKSDEADEDEVYHISSGDEDCSKGMKKWITEYHQSRPGLKVLQQRIDEFITTHEAKLEEERKEREARVSEGGWTVVTQQKGRKKTTDSESGITVGSVAQAAVDDNMAKKKRKEVGLDFYRFQRREAQRNEILSLQSKFEQDKKRIQELRAARRFRPY